MSARRSARCISMALIGVVTFSLTGCVVAPQAPPRETAQATAKVTEAPNVEVASATPAPPKASATVVATPAPAVPETSVMPEYRDWVLQDAQDDLQSMGSYLMDQEDALGTRLQVNDSNWKVCSQDPAAGATTDIGYIITVRVVKLSETCR